MTTKVEEGRPLGMPGPGGSLGECTICGESFIVEMLMSESASEFSLVDNEGNHILIGSPRLFCHKKCKETLASVGTEWRKLPEKGIIYKAFYKRFGGENAKNKSETPKETNPS